MIWMIVSWYIYIYYSGWNIFVIYTFVCIVSRGVAFYHSQPKWLRNLAQRRISVLLWRSSVVLGKAIYVHRSLLTFYVNISMFIALPVRRSPLCCTRGRPRVFSLVARASIYNNKIEDREAMQSCLFKWDEEKTRGLQFFSNEGNTVWDTFDMRMCWWQRFS